MKFFFKMTLAGCFFATNGFCNEDTIYWWHCSMGNNFGDYLGKVIVEKMINRSVRYRGLDSRTKLFLSIGSVLYYARDGDVVWGAGFRENPLYDPKKYQTLDVRAVRGPKTRDYLLRMGIACPEVYGDPALLMSYLFPEFKNQELVNDYIIIPHFTEIKSFRNYKNVVSPLAAWEEIVKQITQSRLVISSSLHGIIVAESYGIPARLLKMTWGECLIKYQDYYESTGRPDFKYATSVQEALQMGGEPAGHIDIEPLLKSFPYDYFEK